MANSASKLLALVPLHDDRPSAFSKVPAAAPRRIVELDARFAIGGVWAGVSTLLQTIRECVRESGDDHLLVRHDYALFMALPGERGRVLPRHLCLTDTATGSEKTRFYPIERSYRLVHGLVGFVLDGMAAAGGAVRWTIVVRHFDEAQHLATRFFAELARRGAAWDRADVIIETQREQADIDASIADLRTILAPSWVTIDMRDVAPPMPLDEAAAKDLQAAIATGGDAVLEEYYPRLLAFYHDRSDGRAVAHLAARVLPLFNRRGYYHEASSLAACVLLFLDDLSAGDESKRMAIVNEINSCLVASGQGAWAHRMVTDYALPHVSCPELVGQVHYMLAMHHLRYLAARDDNMAEFHLLRAVDAMRATRSPESAFLKAFLDNGLAFLRARQKRHQEALDLCRAGYELVTRELGESRHKLHRSVLQYNMAQVHAMLGNPLDALDCYQAAREMDPFYAEYLLEIGEILQRLGRDEDAIAAYDEAITLSEPWPELHLAKAGCLARLNRFLEALQESAISLDLNPKQPELHAARAEILTELGRLDDAVAEYGKALARDPSAVAPRVNRAVLRYSQGAFDLALDDMNAVISLDSQQSAHYENRAAIYQALGRHNLSERDLTHAERCRELA